MALTGFAKAYLDVEDRSKQGLDSFKSGMRSAGDEIGRVRGLLTGLAGALAGGALVMMVKQSIDAVAALDDLRKATGASVESLSIMREVAKLSGTSFEGQIIPSIQKLSRAMLEAQAGGGKAADALKALGLSVTQSNGALKNAGDFMLELADALAKIDNDTARVGFAEKIVKGGSQLIPFLQDLAEEGKNIIAITAEQAAMADKYQDTLTKLGFATEATKREFAIGFLPVLNDVASAFLKGSEKGGGLLEKVQQLRKDGTIDEWAQSVVLALARIVDAFANMTSRLVKFGATIELLSARADDLAGEGMGDWGSIGNFVGGLFRSSDPAKQMMAQAAEQKRKERINQRIQDALDALSDPGLAYKTTVYDSMVAAFANRQPMESGRARGGVAPQLANKEAEREAERIARLQEQADQFVVSLEKETLKIVEQTQQLERYGKVLDEAKEATVRLEFAEGKYKELGTEHAIAKRAIAAAQHADAAARAKKMVEDWAKEEEDINKLYRQQQRAADDYIRSLDDQVEFQRLELSLLGATDAQRRIAIETFRIEIAARKQIEDLKKSGVSLGDKPGEIMAAADRAKEMAAYAERVQEFKRNVIDPVNDLARAAWTGLLSGEKADWDSFCKDLAVSFKRYVADAIYQMLIQPYVINITAQIGGALGMPGAASFAARAGGMGNLSGVPNLFGSGFGNAGAAMEVFNAGGGFGGAASTFLGGNTGLTAAGGAMDMGIGMAGLPALEGAAAGAGAAGAGAMGAVGAAMPYVGVALAAYSLLKGGKKKTPSVFQGYDAPSLTFGPGGLFGTIYGNDQLGNRWAGEQFGGTFGAEAANTYAQIEGLGRRLGKDVSGLRGYAATVDAGSFTQHGEILPRVLEQLSNQLARQVVPNFDSLARAGETAIETLTRLADEQDKVAEAQKEERQRTIARLREEESRTNAALGGFASGLPGRLGIPGLQGFQDALRMSEYLAPMQRFTNARGQLDALYGRAMGGDLDAVSAFPNAAQSFLGIARGVYASGPGFASAFTDTNTMLQVILDRQRELQTELTRALAVSVIETGQNTVKALREEVGALRDKQEETNRLLRELVAQAA